MKILSLSPTPLYEIEYIHVAPKGVRADGSILLMKSPFPFLQANVDTLPPGLDAIFVASDLQGMVQDGKKERLLGEILPLHLEIFLKVAMKEVNPKRVGVILCGDLFASLSYRGGIGDVRKVWNRFKARFKWVAGVAGNHDAFGDATQMEKFLKKKRIHYLEHDLIELEGMQVAGMSGIIGNPNREWRYEAEEFRTKLTELMQAQPQITILHQPPNFPQKGLNGEPVVREVLETAHPHLVFCGHRHWDDPLQTLANGTQVLNMEGRSVILRRV